MQEAAFWCLMGIFVVFSISAILRLIFPADTTTTMFEVVSDNPTVRVFTVRSYEIGTNREACFVRGIPCMRSVHPSMPNHRVSQITATRKSVSVWYVTVHYEKDID